MLEFKMPSLGADMESGFLREWRVKPGDTVKKGDIIAEIETQKGIVEIEVFDEGTIAELRVKVDEKVPVGTVMATILPPGETLPQPAPEEAAETKPPVRKSWVKLRASPLARRIAADKGIDLSTIHGTGPEGAIIKEDVEHAIAAQASPQPEVTALENAIPKAGKTKEQLSEELKTPEEKPAAATIKGASAESVRQAVAAAMSKANREIPHYYLETRIDMTKAQEWLAEANKKRPVKERLLPAALLIKATAKALSEVPDLNATWENNGLQRKNNIHVGYVVSLRTGGIMVPAIHDADLKTVDEIMQALNDLIPRARALRLRSSELADATVTVTCLGEGGVETVYGVIYPPQVALVGFGGISQKPWAENGMLAVRPVLTATLAADHRATDGSTGSKFLKALNIYLQQPESL